MIHLDVPPRRDDVGKNYGVKVRESPLLELDDRLIPLATVVVLELKILSGRPHPFSVGAQVP